MCLSGAVLVVVEIVAFGGAKGLRGDARAGGSNGWKVPSATADKVETQDHHGARRAQGAKKGGRRRWEGAEPLGGALSSPPLWLLVVTTVFT